MNTFVSSLNVQTYMALYVAQDAGATASKTLSKAAGYLSWVPGFEPLAMLAQGTGKATGEPAKPVEQGA